MDWILLDTDKRMEYLMKRVQSFHDATIGGFHIEYGKAANYGYNIILTIVFNVVWCDEDKTTIQNKTIELEFSGLQEFHYCPQEIFEGYPLLPGAEFRRANDEILWKAFWLGSEKSTTTIRGKSVKWRTTDYQGGFQL